MNSQEGILPNFLILGAAKSGTTTVHHYLALHPEVFMSHPKEPYFFALEDRPLDFVPADSYVNMTAVTRLPDYLDLFKDARDYKAVGEASVLYLYSERAVERIKHYIPNARLIVILRNPVERAYSNYMMMRRDNRETIFDFSEALDAEPARIAGNWAFGYHYLNLGLYSRQLRRYYAEFPASQIRVHLYEELRASASGLMRGMYEFLGVDASFETSHDLHDNISGLPKSRALFNLTSRPNFLKDSLKGLLPANFRRKVSEKIKRANMEKIGMSAETRLRLQRFYRDDILALQDLIQRDLSAWLAN